MRRAGTLWALRGAGDRGRVRRRSTLRLSADDVEPGYALACQTVVEGDVAVDVPPQEKIERRLTTDRVVAEVDSSRRLRPRIDPDHPPRVA